MAKDKKKKKITKKLLHKYRLVILNEATFEERLAFKLSRLNVFVTIGISIIILIFLTTILIAFTPLREYIPGYSSVKLRHQATQLIYKTDSLEGVIHEKNKYFNSIRHILLGDSVAEKPNLKPIKVKNIDPDSVDFNPSKADSILRHKVDQEDKYNVFHPAEIKTNFKLFPPVKGEISAAYDAKDGHYAVDIVTTENTPVKATADGTVIFAEWTSETGYVIILEHSYGLISVYKHNSSLTKEQGEHVKAGEVIAMSGNTGEFTTGPHLHFELWSDGYPVNPSDFLDFQ